jgi:hypothetical protein
MNRFTLSYMLAFLVAMLAPAIRSAPAAAASSPPPQTRPSSGPSLATPRAVRGAVRRGLPYIERVASAWMGERKCNSCHTVTFLVWSHNEAAARGLEVDRRKLAEWTKWSLADSLSDRHWFKLRPGAAAAAALGVAGVPDAVLGRLKPLEGKTWLTRQEYLHALEEAIGRTDLAAYEDRLVKEATLPNNGGGPDTLAQLLLARAGMDGDEREKESYAAIRSLLLEWQEPDGSWQAQGQLPGLKWAGPEEMHEATTMWSVLALGAGKSSDAELVRRSRERALASLRRATPGVTLQSLALHMVVADKFGEPGRRDALLRELIGRQGADGGWAWVKENKASDAFATGQALYALGLLDHYGSSDPVVRRAWDFLLRTQHEDGSWEVPQDAVNTRRRGLNVYNYWGTAWATIGLLQTLPTVDPAE